MKLKSLKCDCCCRQFDVSYRRYMSGTYNKKALGVSIYCSLDCKNKSLGVNSSIVCSCKQCGNPVSRFSSQAKKTKNSFCNNHCAGIYNSAHKTTGYRRSKLEIWLEQELTKMYSFEFHFNRKDAIKSELDIYIPSLKLAFELNGIFHYEAIFGADRLSQILNNDDRKFQACIEAGIELCIIDSSEQKYFKIATSQKYLDIITNLVNYKSSSANRVEVL